MKMMKKTYVSPSILLVETKLEGVLCQLSKGDYVNKGSGGGGGGVTIGPDDNSEELTTKGGGLWDDFSFGEEN